METQEIQPTVMLKGFWSRQFSQPISSDRIVFDLLLGVIIPILLLILDPVLFRNNDFNRLSCGVSPLGDYAAFCYIAIGLGMFTLAVWVFDEGLRTNPRWAAFVTGVLMTGVVFAAAMGITLLPMSIPGLILFCIGALGLIPFLTAFVYLRNAVAAFKTSANGSLSRVSRIAIMLAGAVLILAMPAFVQVQISAVIAHAMPGIVANPARPDLSAINELKAANELCFGLCSGNIAAAFDRAEVSMDYTQEESMRVTYQQITGLELPYSCNEASD